jgi:hypothetical protein
MVRCNLWLVAFGQESAVPPFGHAEITGYYVLCLSLVMLKLMVIRLGIVTLNPPALLSVAS